MVGHTVLKKRHSLEGKGVGLRLVKRIRDSGAVKQFARFAPGVDTSKLSDEDLEERFRALTGEDIAEILGMAGKETETDHRRLACHFAIVLANELGQPRGQDLQAGTSEETPDQPDEEPGRKKAKLELERRISKLEEAAPDEVSSLRDKVDFAPGETDERIEVPVWERELKFDPTEAMNATRKHPVWLTLGGETFSPASDSIDSEKQGDVKSLRVRDPDNFVAGELHRHEQEWDNISDYTDGQVLSWIKEKVDAVSFFRVFKGNFQGRSYECGMPQRRYFQNSKGCKPFGKFIASELLERIRDGSFRVWGRVGECQTLPKVIMPIVVEPSKPRMCHDERYINLWVKDLPFKLDTLRDTHRMVGKDAKMMSCDDKSGYSHVLLTEESHTYFGIQFGVWVMSYTALPFGWKASAYIYQSIGMVATSHLRSLGIPYSLYIDDRLGVETATHTAEGVSRSMVSLLTDLGYTLSLRKSVLAPSSCLRYLGFIIDSNREAYILPQDKKQTFAELRESILSCSEVNVKTLQRFAGKCVSMSLVVPGARLYSREVNAALSKGSRNSRVVTISVPLKREIEYWRFVDTWDGCAKWRLELHKQVVLATDASLYRYGAMVVNGEDSGLSLGDYWGDGDTRPIHLKEAEALLRVLMSLRDSLVDHRVDV